MSISEKSEFENEVETVAITMKDVPTSIRLFSLTMRSLYAEKAVSGSSDTTKAINKLRDDTRNDALIYTKVVLPVSTELVRILKEFFEYYEELEFEEWKESLSDIVEEVKGYRQCCSEVIRLHEEIMIPLKRKQDEANVLLKEMQELNDVLVEKIKELEQRAATKSSWAIALAFIPGVNVIATPLLGASAEGDMAQAVADGAQCDINIAVIAAVGDAMIPALSEFIVALECIAGFFKVVEEEITTFQSKGEKAVDHVKLLHYKMMKRKLLEIKQSCTDFFAVIPAVQSDLDSIPDEGTDQNYVDRWLKKQQDEIKKKYASNISKQLKSLFETIVQAGKLMIEGNV